METIENCKKQALERHQFHFNLSHLDKDEDLLLLVGFDEYPIYKHDSSTIKALKENSLFYRHIPENCITHYVDGLELSEELICTMRVEKYREKAGRKTAGHIALSHHIPRASCNKMLDKYNAHAKYANGTIHPKLAKFNINDIMRELSDEDKAREFYLDSMSYKDSLETAEAILLHHPDLLHLGGDTEYPAWIKEHLLDSNPYINELVLTIMELGEDWCTMEIAVDEHGNPVKNPDKPEEYIYTRKLNQEVVSACTGPLNWAVNKAKDSKELEGQVWNVQYGKTSDTYHAALSMEAESDTERAGRSREVKAGDCRWIFNNHTPSWGLTFDNPVLEADKKKVKMTGYNKWPRHLGTYVEYINAAGKRMELTDQEWDEVVGGLLRSIIPKELFELVEPRKHTKFKDFVNPCTTVCGIPLGSLIPDPTTYEFPLLKDDVYTVRMLWGGLGYNCDSLEDAPCATVGGMLTVILDLFIPIVILVIGSTDISNKVLKAITEDKKLLATVLGIALTVITAQTIQDILNGKNIINIITPYVGMILPSLLITKLGPYILEKIGESSIGQFLKAVLPEAGTAMQIFGAATTTAAILETTAACVSGPAVYKVDIIRSIDLSISVKPDVNYHKFPEIAALCKVQVVYDCSATTPVCEMKVDFHGTTRSDPFEVKFADVPAAGKLKVMVFFYADNGWQAGQGESEWVEAKGVFGTLLHVSVDTTINIVPLTIDSVYRHKQKIIYDNGKLSWKATEKQPTATYQTISPDPQRSINTLNGTITLAQYPEMAGYTWQAKGLYNEKTKTVSGDFQYTVQNISVLAEPEKGLWYPDEGYKLISCACYDLAGPETAEGRNFFVDPSKGIYDERLNKDGGLHLRKLMLVHGQKPVVDTTLSWGRFNNPIEGLAIHPQGFAFGINYTYCRLEILKLPDAPTVDSAARFAALASGEGFRDGLINGPSGISITLDGRVLVLESKNNRIQAFDVFGNPVKCFRIGGKDSCWFPLIEEKDKVHYLDLTAESKGYIYVLSFKGEGVNMEDYMMDIYTPEGSFLVRTPDIAASKIAVGILRDVYALNFEIIFGKNKRPQPSVSLWVPPAPKEQGSI
jgi:hypothetical protein